jgi:hypothetical protein
MSQSAQKPRLKRPVEQVRAELLNDPDTKRIAKAVGMELKDYVEMVLDYAQNPDKEPMMNVAPDEELRAAGYEPPSTEEVAKFFVDTAKEMIKEGDSKFGKSAFESGKPAAGGKPSLSGSTPAPIKVDED